MAEFVQRKLEEALPELEQLERVGLFTREEIKSIIKKKTAYEYRLNRLRNETEDFLKYIEYERSLLKLIHRRRKKIHYFFKKEEIEHTIIGRIERLYKRLCTMYPADLSLWLSQFRFLRQWKRFNNLSKMFTKLLKINSRIPGLWILAAKTQLEYNSNPDDARKLLLRAIRYHPECQKLWIEYFRMELLHAHKLNKRMAILQQSQMSLEGEEARLLKGELANLVYKSAIQTMPDDIEMRLKLAKISEGFNFAEQITNVVYEDLQRDHPDKEVTWNALARRPLTSITKAANAETEIWAGERRCHQIFEEGLQRLPSSELWGLYTDFCYERLRCSGSRDISDKRVSHLLSIYSRASGQSGLSSDNFLKWMDVLVKTGQVDGATEAAERATTAYPSSPAVWEQRLKLVMRRAIPPEAMEEHRASVRRLFDAAISQVRSKNSQKIWTIGLEWCLLQDDERAENLLEAACNEHRNVSLPFKECYVDHAAMTRGIKKSRKVYKRLSLNKPLSVEFFKKKITLEKTQLNPSLSKLRATYEDALVEFGSQEPDLWLDYVAMESGCRQISSLGNVRKLYWRAKGQLDGVHVERFVSSYALLQLSQG